MTTLLLPPPSSPVAEPSRDSGRVASMGGSDSSASSKRSAGTGLIVVGLTAIVLLAFVVRLGLVLRGGGLLGIGAYDDGVYYAAAVRFVHGDFPYRDFVFLQPPGIVLVLAPFAALARVVGDPAAVVGFRLAFELLGAANAGLVFLALRRVGWSAALIGGAFYAVFFPAAYDERTALLEPIGSAGVLLAVVLLGRWREGVLGARAMTVAGIVLGAAVDLKIWYLIPALVIVAFSRGARARIAIGAGGVVLAGYLPFFIAAPASSLQQIVFDQVGRARGASIQHRFETFLGLIGNDAPSAVPHVAVAALVPPAAIGLGVLVAVAWREPRARVMVVLLTAAIVVLTLSPASYIHYAVLVAVPLALVVGVACNRAIGLLRRQAAQVLAVACVILMCCVWNGPNDLRGTDRSMPDGLASAVDRVDGCVVADDPTALAVAGVLTREVGSGCRIEPDLSGISFDSSGRPASGGKVTRARNPIYQAHVLRYFDSASAFLVVRNRTGLSRANRAVLESRRPIYDDGVWVLRSGASRVETAAQAAAPSQRTTE